MDVVASGHSLTVYVTEEGKDSWQQAETHVPPNKAACKAQLRTRLKQLAETGWLKTPDAINSEGEHIHAVKARCGLRAYGWFGADENDRKAFIIAHVVLKKGQKAKPSDLDRTRRLRLRWKEGD